MKLILFLLFIFVFGIEITLPVGPISNNSIYGPLNYTISNMKLNFVDPGIGLSNVTWYRVLNKLPEDFPPNLIPLLIYHLKSASFRQAEFSNPGEILIVTGESKCGPEIRLVTLTDGNLDHLISLLSGLIPTTEQKSKCCSKILNSHYGTKSCEGSKERTIYLVTPGSTYYDWSSAEGSNDPPLDSQGLKLAGSMHINLEDIDLVISGTQDASMLIGEIISRKLKTNLWIDNALSQKCGLQYESWRILERTPLYHTSKSIMDLLNELSTEFFNIVLVMDSCTGSSFVKFIGYQNEVHPGSILEINLQNLTGIPHWYFHLISEGSNSISCSITCNPAMTLNSKLLDGSDIDYTLSQLDLLKLTPTEQSNYFRLQYEREIWTKIYWNYRNLFREDLIQEKHGIRYWGRFPMKIYDTDELIGIHWFEIIKDIWFKK